MKTLKKVNLSIKIGGYDFECYNLTKYDLNDNFNFPETSGTYIFGVYKQSIKTYNELLDENYIPVNILYCGKTENLRTRFANHHIIDDLQCYLPCYLCYHTFDNVKDAEILEAKIIESYNPLLNERHPHTDE